MEQINNIIVLQLPKVADLPKDVIKLVILDLVHLCVGLYGKAFVGLFADC